MEVLILWWSTETYTFVTTWGEFPSAIEDISLLRHPLLFAETNTKRFELVDQNRKGKMMFLVMAMNA